MLVLTALSKLFCKCGTIWKEAGHLFNLQLSLAMTAVYELSRPLFNLTSASSCPLFAKISCLLPYGDFSILISLLISPILLFFFSLKEIHCVIAQTKL